MGEVPSSTARNFDCLEEIKTSPAGVSVRREIEGCGITQVREHLIPGCVDRSTCILQSYHLLPIVKMSLPNILSSHTTRHVRDEIEDAP